MECNNPVLARRSIRKYQAKTIEEEKIELLLRAAMAAPSAGNEQPWEFILIRNPDTMRRITEIHPYSSMLLHADTAIVVCGNRNRQKYERDYWILDCAAATENILIQAVVLGLGAVWLAVYPEPDRIEGIKRLFSIPEHVIPLAIVSLGYADEIKKTSDRYDEYRIHYECWSKSRNDQGVD